MWTHLDLPAVAEAAQEIPIGDRQSYRRAAGELLHPAREPMAALEELKAAMGSQAFSAQYQQAPVPPGGALLRRSWFRTYARAPERKSGDRIVQSWDTASKASTRNDYSVCTTWLVQGKDSYLLDFPRASRWRRYGRHDDQVDSRSAYAFRSGLRAGSFTVFTSESSRSALNASVNNGSRSWMR